LHLRQRDDTDDEEIDDDFELSSPASSEFSDAENEVRSVEIHQRDGELDLDGGDETDDDVRGGVLRSIGSVSSVSSLEHTKHDIAVYAQTFISPRNSNLQNIAIDAQNHENESELTLAEEAKNDTEAETEAEADSVPSWAEMLRSRVLGGDNSARMSMKAVMDLRLRELALSVLEGVWKSPFAKVSDSQLALSLFVSASAVCAWLGRSRRMRAKAVRAVKYLVLLLLMAVAVASFIELNVRKRSRVFRRMKAFLDEWLFYNAQNKEIKRRRNGENGFGGRAMDRKGRASRTMPNLYRGGGLKRHRSKGRGPSLLLTPQSEKSGSMSQSSTSVRSPSELKALKSVPKGQRLKRTASAFA